MSKRSWAFTLAEVVITLIVIGVVSAITIPMLSNDINDKKWNVARQKAQATIGEAFRLMTVNGEINQNLSTAEFVENVIPKYLKLAKTCSTSNSKDCGMSVAANFYKRPDGNKVTLPTTWATSTTPQIVSSIPTTPTQLNTSILGTSAIYSHSSPNTNNSYMFKTLDGFSVNFFYNPYCATGDNDKYYVINLQPKFTFYGHFSMDAICLMGVYDMNGLKGPNKVGMDIGFIGSFFNGYETKSAAVLPHKTEKQVANNNVGATFCQNLGSDNEWRLPSVNEASLIYLNLVLTKGVTSTRTANLLNNSSFWNGSSGVVSLGLWDNYGLRTNTSCGNYCYVRCVRKTALK